MESERIRDYLFSVYGATEDDLCRASRCWKSLRRGELSRAARRTLRSALPDLTEILSCIDILTQEDLSVGTYETEERSRFSPRRAIDARELRSLRRSFGRALVRSFNELDDRMPARTIIDEFCSHLGPQDAVITTNWDILLDRALDRAFGTALEDYGTPVQWFADQKESKVPQRRPPLYKLHGSMNWLQCRRCQALYVDPGANVALVDFDDTAQFGTCKECSFKLTTLGLRQAAAPRPGGAPAGGLPPSGAKASAARLSLELREMEARRLARERRHAQGNGKGDHAPARLQVLH